MPCTNDPCIQQTTYIRAILNGLIDGQSDDALGTALSEVLKFIDQQDSENKRLRNALAEPDHPTNERVKASIDWHWVESLWQKGGGGIFRTSDGYTLYYCISKLEGSRDDCDLGPNCPATGIWIDSLDPELQDSFWYGDMLGPWDADAKERLEGKLES